MHSYNKPRSRLTLSPNERYLLGPQFTLHASATAVQERQPNKKDGSGKPVETAQNGLRRPMSLGECSMSTVVVDPLNSTAHRQGSSGSTSRRNGGSTSTGYDLGSGNIDQERRSTHSLTDHANSLSTYLPGDRVSFGDSTVTPGIPVVYRAPEEKSANAERLNLDRRYLAVCPILEGEDQLRLLNFQHNAIMSIENLDSLKRLIFLDFYDNQIDRISGLGALRSLRVLMLGKNRIKKVEGLDNLTKLDVLDLHGNQIRHIENIQHLSELRVLNLAGNVIDQVKNLRGLDSLTELNLRRNKIHTVTDVDCLPNLQRLFLSFNEITTFDDISCVSDSLSLSELSLDGNPMSHESSYKQTVLRHMQQLRQFDMKRITDDERRIAAVMGRKEEEKRRESSKMAVLVERRRRAITNARQQWEVMQSSMMSHNNHKTSRHTSNTKPELYANHVANVPNDYDTLASDYIDRPSSAKSNHSGTGDKEWVSEKRPSTVGPSTNQTSTTAARPRETRQVNADSLSEIEGDTLSLYGIGSLDAFDKNWGIQAAGAVTNICFQFIEYNEIVKVLPKIRVRFPNVNSLVFNTTNIQSMSQLNALASVRRLDSLTIEPGGNPVTTFKFWRSYVVFRLAHFSLKKVNGTEVGVQDIVAAEKFFAPLGNTISSVVTQARLMTLLGDKKKQLLTDDKTKRPSTDVFTSLSTTGKTETVGRAVLVYGSTDVPANKPQDEKLYRGLVKNMLQSLTQEAIQADRKHEALATHWPTILTDMVRSAVIDMWDTHAYVRRCMEQLDKTKPGNKITAGDTTERSDFGL